MKRPVFQVAAFNFHYNSAFYTVEFVQDVSDKTMYIISVTDFEKALYYDKHREMATKTTALFYLCKALNLPTTNIR